MLGSIRSLAGVKNTRISLQISTVNDGVCWWQISINIKISKNGIVLSNTNHQMSISYGSLYLHSIYLLRLRICIIDVILVIRHLLDRQAYCVDICHYLHSSFSFFLFFSLLISIIRSWICVIIIAAAATIVRLILWNRNKVKNR